MFFIFVHFIIVIIEGALINYFAFPPPFQPSFFLSLPPLPHIHTHPSIYIYLQHYSLPATLAAGSATLTNAGTYNIKVVIQLDTTITTEYTRSYQCYYAYHSLWPLVIIITFAITTGIVRIFFVIFLVIILQWRRNL